MLRRYLGKEYGKKEEIWKTKHFPKDQAIQNRQNQKRVRSH